MKKLMICGCSFSAPALPWQPGLVGTSWSEKLAKKLNMELVNVARQGCSNGGIRIQMDEVLKVRPDFAIIIPTFWDRIEIPAVSDIYPPLNSWKDTFQLAKYLWGSGRGDAYTKGYDRKLGINNINRNTRYDTDPKEFRLICETIHSLVGDSGSSYRPNTPISPELCEAVKQYVNFIYDSNWKKQMDQWIILEGIFQLYLNDIKFLFVPEILWAGSSEFEDKVRSIDQKYFVENSYPSPRQVVKDHPFSGPIDPGYHGSEESQEILSDMYYDIINKRWNLQ